MDFSELCPEEQKQITFLPSYELSEPIEDIGQRIDWGVKLVNAPSAWHITKGSGVKVAVLDTGADVCHKDLKEGIKDYEDFTGRGKECENDCVHGTHVAGIIGARDNSIGVVGVAPECDLYIGKVVAAGRGGLVDWLVKGIDHAVQEWDVDIINMSLGTIMDHPELKQAIERAAYAGKIVICAAGNHGAVNTIEYPARYPQTITISAINSDTSLYQGSSRGLEIDFATPGSEILSTAPGDNYIRKKGTSTAAPFASGLAALAIAKHRIVHPNSQTPLNNVWEMREHFKRMAMDLGPIDKDCQYGFGLMRLK